MSAGPSELQSFLSDLRVDRGWLLFWGLPSKRSEWVSALTDETMTMLTQWAEREDLYVGCGVAGQQYGPTLRCPADEVIGIPGLWLDVDFGPGHKKPNLPKTQEEALRLIESMGPPPTWVIHSGHGLQAWWLFEEPWMFDHQEERAMAAKLCKDWSATLRARARQQGWDADQVGDLARVMRLPGTWNRKGVPVRTSVLTSGGPRYQPSSFERYLLAETVLSEPTPDLSWAFTLSATAEPPANKFLLLCEADPLFKLTWLHARKDLQDQSASSYDLALATRALRGGWQAQEIVSLLIAHRRQHRQDLKLREDYYRRTLNVAARGKAIEDRSDLIQAAKQTGDLPESVMADPAEAMAIISELLGVKITKLIRYIAQPNRYEIELNGRRVPLGPIENLTSQAKFRNLLVDVADILIEKQGPKTWDTTVRRLIQLVQNVEVGPEGTQLGAVEGYVQIYLDDGVKTGAWEEAAVDHRPFRRDGKTWISSRGLRQFIFGHGERFTPQEMALTLRKLGWEQEKIQVRRKKGDYVTLRCWVL